MSEREDREVAVDTGKGGGSGTRQRRTLGPGRPNVGFPGISPSPPSTWAPPVAGGSLGFGGATPERKAALAEANRLASTSPDFLRVLESFSPGQGILDMDRQWSGVKDYPQPGSPYYIPGAQEEDMARIDAMRNPVEEPASMTFQEWAAANMGTFDSSPYDDYMNFLLQQDEETMARINAMYSQLAESAEGNMQRVADVYDSARIQSGDVFGGSAQNIEDAYSSASQQAADQMARLGVEAAAPGVLDPMALSQAEAVSGIERAGAGALDALTRYGTSAQDFGGQMAQVGQQQGLEVSSQILRDMQQRQAEAAFMRSQAQADFNPYQRAMQEMEAQQMFDQMNAGQDPMELVEQMRIAQDRALTLQDRFIKLAQSYADQDIKTTGKINTNPGETPEERARMMLDLVGSDDFGYPMPTF